MPLNKKVPSNGNSKGTGKLFMIPLKNESATTLYTKKSFFSSYVLSGCMYTRTLRRIYG